MFVKLVCITGYDKKEKRFDQYFKANQIISIFQAEGTDTSYICVGNLSGNFTIRVDKKVDELVELIAAHC